MSKCSVCSRYRWNTICNITASMQQRKAGNIKKNKPKTTDFPRESVIALFEKAGEYFSRSPRAWSDPSPSSENIGAVKWPPRTLEAYARVPDRVASPFFFVGARAGVCECVGLMELITQVMTGVTESYEGKRCIRHDFTAQVKNSSTCHGNRSSLRDIKIKLNLKKHISLDGLETKSLDCAL